MWVPCVSAKIQDRTEGPPEAGTHAILHRMSVCCPTRDFLFGSGAAGDAESSAGHENLRRIRASRKQVGPLSAAYPLKSDVNDPEMKHYVSSSLIP
jgi:hypothetical protein